MPATRQNIPARRQPRRPGRAGRDAGPLRLGRGRAAALPDRGLRHGQVAPADRAGHRGGRAGLPGPLRHRHRPGQRARRGRRRPHADQGDRPLRADRPALPGRARLHRAGPARRRAALPGFHRERGEELHRDRVQRRVQRVGPGVHRSPALRRDRRPPHLRRPHHHHRNWLLPAPRHHRPPPGHRQGRPRRQGERHPAGNGCA